MSSKTTQKATYNEELCEERHAEIRSNTKTANARIDALEMLSARTSSDIAWIKKIQMVELTALLGLAIFIIQKIFLG